MGWADDGWTGEYRMGACLSAMVTVVGASAPNLHFFWNYGESQLLYTIAQVLTTSKTLLLGPNANQGPGTYTQPEGQLFGGILSFQWGFPRARYQHVLSYSG